MPVCVGPICQHPQDPPWGGQSQRFCSERRAPAEERELRDFGRVTLVDLRDNPVFPFPRAPPGGKRGTIRGRHNPSLNLVGELLHATSLR